MTNTPTPLLTIAFPTYNRCEILDRALGHLLGDPDFDNSLIEVLVSDDASTDHTVEVVAKYPTVRYHRNPKNVKFGNHTVVMGLANGKYVKLQNDTSTFRPGTLKLMLQKLQEAERDNMNIFFANSLINLKHGEVVVHNSSEFLDVVSFYVSWSVNFGMWKADFDQIQDPNKFIESQIQQVDWGLSGCDKGRKTKIVAGDFFDVVNVKKKASYNLFDAFVNKYLAILRYHNIKGWALEKEKYRLFRYFILDWYFRLKRDKEYQYDTTNQNTIIIKEYWYEPYFIPFMLIKMLRK